MVRRVTLTFDNGPDAVGTPLILDVLAKHGVKSTFFLVGSYLERPGMRALAQKAHAAGHWIGNHTMTHLVPLGEDTRADAVALEVAQTQRLLGEFAHPRRLFRPFGDGGNLDRRLLNPAAITYLRRERFSCVLWNVIPRDWEDPDGWPARALDRCANHSWSVVVLHDEYPSGLRHLDAFIQSLKDDGYDIVQDFPADCIAIDQGEVMFDLSGITASAETG